MMTDYVRMALDAGLTDLSIPQIAHGKKLAECGRAQRLLRQRSHRRSRGQRHRLHQAARTQTVRNGFSLSCRASRSFIAAARSPSSRNQKLETAVCFAAQRGDYAGSQSVGTMADSVRNPLPGRRSGLPGGIFRRQRRRHVVSHRRSAARQQRGRPALPAARRRSADCRPRPGAVPGRDAGSACSSSTSSTSTASICARTGHAPTRSRVVL